MAKTSIFTKVTCVLLLALFVCFNGACSPEESATEPKDEGTSALETSSISETKTKEFPIVTLRHWQDSTPNERYAFLIGFVTMLELEKEWQVREGEGVLPFELSLAGAWAEGFAARPLTEIYNSINGYIISNPEDLDKPTAEVMWFEFVQPLRDKYSEKTNLSPLPELGPSTEPVEPEVESESESESEEIATEPIPENETEDEK